MVNKKEIIGYCLTALSWLMLLIPAVYKVQGKISVLYLVCVVIIGMIGFQTGWFGKRVR